MGKRGPPPKPLHLVKLTGAVRRDRHARHIAAEPQAQGDLAAMAPPAWLSADQRRIWRQTIADAPAGLLKRIDAEVFGAYCELIDRHRTAVAMQATLDRSNSLPYLTKTRDGVMISPYVKIIDRCVILMRALQQEMGFTPASRARFGGPAETREGNDEWSELYRLRVIPGGKSGPDAGTGPSSG